ncbi:MAG: aspartate--tRNA ligase [Candidatus Pacebacteria bacterium]|nr:aspartate--tRNA ligase [Candidatus Paceibacterota bacterium]
MQSDTKTKRTYIKDLKDCLGTEVTIAGWVSTRRDQGKLIFLDFRDKTGYVQGVILPNAVGAHSVGTQLRSEWVVEVQGKVNARPERNIQKEKQNGELELEILSITVLNESETPIFDISQGTDTREVGEDVRLAYRYLDLRSDRLQKNIRARHKVVKFVRDFLDSEGFIEVETPMLTKSTPEGARDYVVPSRLERGHFYALPQSPQQYKQLLMTGGIEKYFQIARCMRDEDTRGDRQPEFTQLDLEMSFAIQGDVMDLNERLLVEIVTKLYPEKRIQQVPFPRISYKEALAKYNSDRPDMRDDKNDPGLLAFCWVVDFPFFEKTDKGQNGSPWTFTHNPFSRAKPEHENWLMKNEKIGEILTSQYDIVLNGFEIGGGSIRNHDPEKLLKVFDIMGYSKESVEENFGHMLKAFRLGTPPHGGIAWGFDRLMMLLQNEPNIREVIAFPKTGEGRDLMMNSPAEISSEQLLELGITIKKPEVK